jgi:hypothetical protein
VAVFLQDGGIVRGRLQGVHELDPLEAHRALAARLPDDVRLPSKGDIVRITVYGASGSAIFERVARPGERYEELGKASMARATTPVALFASGSRSGLLGSPLASIDRLQWRDGIEMRGPDLSDAVVAAGLPDPQVLVLTDSTGAADSIPAWNVRGVEAPRLKPWAGRGALIGSSLDFTMAYLYIRAREALGRALQ